MNSTLYALIITIRRHDAVLNTRTMYSVIHSD